jgi:PAS domain S-box-containing protein
MAEAKGRDVKTVRGQRDREHAQAALIDTPELLRLLVENARDYAIFALDTSGHVLTWNPGAENIKGYTAEEIIGRHFSTFYVPEEVAAHKPDRELEIARAEGRYEEEGWRVRKDGTLFWANVVITALLQDGQHIGFAKVTRDLTERRAAGERALEDARRVGAAEAANRAKTEFLTMLSHELRTPLNAIGGYIDLLALGIRGPVTEQQQEDLTRIRRSQQHLLSIINDLLNFSRLESGRVTYDIARVPLADVAESVYAMVEPQANTKGIELAWPAPKPEAAVSADRSKLEQILLNLVTNALKFTPAGGRITLACVEDGERMRISVADTGIGIAQESLDAIFDPFVQVGRSLSSTHEGAGLGLAISRDLARAMDGDLTVESTPGAGTTFTLTLPLALAA